MLGRTCDYRKLIEKATDLISVYFFM